MTFSSIEEVLEEYPEAAPFADLIAAGSVDEFAEVAQEIAKKVNARNAPENPKHLNAPTATKETTVKDAIDARDWSGFLAARWVEQNEGNNRG
jgi:hypothetical protein